MDTSETNTQETIRDQKVLDLCTVRRQYGTQYFVQLTRKRIDILLVKA